jgi:hypothetical protein
MDLAFIHQLYACNEWANARYFAAARALSDDRGSTPDMVSDRADR